MISHSDYIQGFNEGYLLAEHLPELTDKLSNDFGKTDRSAGFRDGVKEYQLQKSKARLPVWLKDSPMLNQKKTVQDKDKNRDKDDLQRE